MTCEHVVPISRGGTNNLSNIVALCQPCNESKGNLLYMPETFYVHLENKYFKQVCGEFYDWFKTIRGDFNLTRYPLITPVTRLPVYKEFKNKKKFIVGNIDVHYVNKYIRAEVEAVASIELDPNKTYYLIKSVRDDKLLALYSISWFGINMTLTIEWSILDSGLLATATTTLIRIILGLYHNIGIYLSSLSVEKYDSKFFDSIIPYRNMFTLNVGKIERLSSTVTNEYSGIILHLKNRYMDK